MPKLSDLPYLIRLLDDDDPAVFSKVNERLAEFGGDISEDLTALGLRIPAAQKQRLSSLLIKGRRKILASEWQVPTQGQSAWDKDWESFEHALSLLSDFLHDGLTLRPRLPDCLDMLADEARRDLSDLGPNELRKWLFVSGRFRGVKKNPQDYEHFDLCHVLDHQRGNYISLAFIFMLLGHRLGVSVDGFGIIAQFLARIDVDDKVLFVNCAEGGRIVTEEFLIYSNPAILGKNSDMFTLPGNLSEFLCRYIHELMYSMHLAQRNKDKKFLKKLARSLMPPHLLAP